MPAPDSVAKLLDAPFDQEKLEVFLEPGDKTQTLVLRYSTWTDGLGWCGQKTIKVNETQIDDLHRALTVARQKLSRHRSEDSETSKPGKVITVAFGG